MNFCYFAKVIKKFKTTYINVTTATAKKTKNPTIMRVQNRLLLNGCIFISCGVIFQIYWYYAFILKIWIIILKLMNQLKFTLVFLLPIIEMDKLNYVTNFTIVAIFIPV